MKCKKCSAECQTGVCLDCEYRNGRKLAETPTASEGDIPVDSYFRKPHFRDAFTWEQRQQTSPSER